MGLISTMLNTYHHVFRHNVVVRAEVVLLSLRRVFHTTICVLSSSWPSAYQHVFVYVVMFQDCVRNVLSTVSLGDRQHELVPDICSFRLCVRANLHYTQDAFDGEDKKMFAKSKEEVAKAKDEGAELRGIVKALRVKVSEAAQAKAKAKAKPCDKKKKAPTVGRPAVKFEGGLPSGDDVRAALPPGYHILSDALNKRFRVHRGAWNCSQSWGLHGVAGAGRNVLRESWRHAISVGTEVACPIEGLL